MRKRSARHANRNVYLTTPKNHALHDYATALKLGSHVLNRSGSGAAVLGIADEDHAAATTRQCLAKGREFDNPGRRPHMCHGQQNTTDDQRAGRQQAEIAHWIPG